MTGGSEAAREVSEISPVWGSVKKVGARASGRLGQRFVRVYIAKDLQRVALVIRGSIQSLNGSRFFIFLQFPKGI